MGTPSTSPAPYRVIPSPHVATELRALLKRARSGGFHREVLEALKRINYLLTIYPQFGEPLMDLQATGETLYLGAIPPLCFKYVIDESLRTVFIGTPFQALPNAGFD